MDVAAWLRGLGLERYEPLFRDNDVDAEVLTKLTADDLVSIGVISVGHRRKLLDAIAALDAAIPAAAVTALLTAVTSFSGTESSTMSATSRRLTAPGAIVVRSIVLSTPKVFDSVLCL